MRVIENIQLVTQRKRILNHKILIEKSQIIDILPQAVPLTQTDVRIIDGRNLLATAGFIDLHLHTDCDCQDEQTQFDIHQKMLRFQAQNGVTGIFPTVIPIEKNNYENLRTLNQHINNSHSGMGTKILGVHLEGPFLNPKMRGGFPANFLQEPSVAKFNYWQEITENRIKRITISPELPGNLEIVHQARKDGIVVSPGHTEADNSYFSQYYVEDCRLITHFLNAMQPFHHRKPGAVGAILAESGFVLEIIADGLHLDPLAVKFCMNLPHQKVLISDSIYVLYLPEGRYSYLDQQIIWDGKIQKNSAGTLVGSSLTLNQAVRNVQTFTGDPLENILPMANENPARIMGLTTKGQLAKNYDADIILLDEAGKVYFTMIEGNIVHSVIDEKV